MSHGFRASALGAIAALLMAPMLTACSTSSDSDSHDTNTSDSSNAEEKTEDAESAETIDLSEWRDRARDAAFSEIPLSEECADLYPDSITEKAAEYVGPDIFETLIGGLINAPSISCKFTAEFDDWGRGTIELTTETESVECDDLTPGVDGIVADDPIDASSAISLTAQGCTADGILHKVEIMAFDDEPRYDYAQDSAFVEEVVALMLEEQDSFLEKALELYEQIE